ncbi:MAG TPA: GNAT family N-acetyltransferase [Gemmatimonadales bacterium]|nr:GNAT family N-acetyltransferase [Gemmatimonadales bacterium]
MTGAGGADPGAGEAVVLRRATAADALVLARLRYEFRSTIGTPTEPEDGFLRRCAAWMTTRLGGAPEARAPWRAWVAVRGNEVVGTIWLGLVEKIPNPVAEPETHGYVTSLYVRPEARGAGIGGRLLEAALAECEASGVDAVFLWPTPRSRSLYRRHGFEPAGEGILTRHPGW